MPLKLFSPLILILFILIGCNPPPIKGNKAKDETESPSQNKAKGASDYILAFNKVDNKVDVFINDSLIYTSGFIGYSPELDLQVDFGQFIKNGNEVLRIELYNGYEPYDDQIDPLWEVRYDLIIEGEIVDFIHEYGDDNGIGKVFETQYKINEWTDLNE